MTHAGSCRLVHSLGEPPNGDRARERGGNIPATFPAHPRSRPLIITTDLQAFPKICRHRGESLFSMVRKGSTVRVRHWASGTACRWAVSGVFVFLLPGVGTRRVPPGHLATVWTPTLVTGWWDWGTSSSCGSSAPCWPMRSSGPSRSSIPSVARATPHVSTGRCSPPSCVVRYSVSPRIGTVDAIRRSSCSIGSATSRGRGAKHAPRGVKRLHLERLPGARHGDRRLKAGARPGRHRPERGR